jgi:Tol biopolymer transport system component
MELTMRRARVPRAVSYLLLLLLLALLAVVAFAAIGSQRRVPPPFGLASNGRIAYVTDGDIAAVDPITGDVQTVVAGAERDRSPTYSLDGTRIAFVRGGDDGDDVYVADAVTGALTRLTDEPMPGGGATGLLTWSPDGTQLAFRSAGDLWIAQADGSGARRVELGFPVMDELEWRPPDGRELLVRIVRSGQAGLFLLPADGSAPARAITPIDGGTYDYLWVTWAPDGRQVAYHIETEHEVHILTVSDAVPVVLRPVDGRGLMFPRFSPDGSRLAVMAWHDDGSVQVGVLPADDPTPVVTLVGPVFRSGIQFDWSPDGSEILVVGWNTDEPWILDPAGGPGRRTTWSMAAPDWVEWQRLAR